VRAFRSISGRTVKIFAAVVQKIEEVEDEASGADRSVELSSPACEASSLVGLALRPREGGDGAHPCVDRSRRTTRDRNRPFADQPGRAATCKECMSRHRTFRQFHLLANCGSVAKENLRAFRCAIVLTAGAGQEACLALPPLSNVAQ